jgi:hypothetical protein
LVRLLVSPLQLQLLIQFITDELVTKKNKGNGPASSNFYHPPHIVEYYASQRILPPNRIPFHPSQLAQSEENDPEMQAAIAASLANVAIVNRNDDPRAEEVLGFYTEPRISYAPNITSKNYKELFSKHAKGKYGLIELLLSKLTSVSPGKHLQPSQSTLGQRTQGCHFSKAL